MYRHIHILCIILSLGTLFRVEFSGGLRNYDACYNVFSISPLSTIVRYLGCCYIYILSRYMAGPQVGLFFCLTYCRC